MRICHVNRVFESMMRGWHKHAVSLRAGLAASLALFLVGCASSVSVVETWDGNPEAAERAATLKTPGEIRVVRVNDRSMTNFLMDDLALDYALLPGENEVVFVYKTIWAKTGVVSNGESKVHVIESEPQVARFEAAAGEIYHFEYDRPDTRQEAERMMPEFSASVVSSSGQSVASSSVWDPAEAITASRTPIPESPSDGTSASGGNALDQLKAVWETASDEEKKAFLRWAFE
ncbi:DUF2057 domain-containing protein [Marinobacter guineae]|uniref:DUF2057 domain-containing protein n=1 Tax=Marinobacter guineae TaxID=432303 RepID=A0A2G1VAV8_9GAMM|nr:DUF2057 family protein [Marinobacter guineae]PHQ23896.1 DUF2057 domain-containing protein [Marinobacter guineae]